MNEYKSVEAPGHAEYVAAQVGRIVLQYKGHYLPPSPSTISKVRYNAAAKYKQIQSEAGDEQANV